MRELKFRIWNGTEMIKWSINQPPGETPIKSFHIGSIMQFTGLCDCNNSEIWEGDFVKALRRKIGRGQSNIVGYDEILLEVVFDASRGSFRLQNNKMQYSNFFGLEDSYEVVGNIHENLDIFRELRRIGESI